MSHSKTTKRGRSLYIDKFNPASKKFIVTCSVCGASGYDPSIEDEGFIHPSPECTDYVHRAIYAELTSTLKPLALDSLGRCAVCTRLMDK